MIDRLDRGVIAVLAVWVIFLVIKMADMNERIKALEHQPKNHGILVPNAPTR